MSEICSLFSIEKKLPPRKLRASVGTVGGGGKAGELPR
jgi:hypothetical protein